MSSTSARKECSTLGQIHHIYFLFSWAAKFWQGRNFESQLLSKHHLSYSNNLPSHFLGFAFYFIFRFTWLWWRTHFSQIKSFDFLHFFVNLKRKYTMWVFPNVSKYQNGDQLFFFCFFVTLQRWRYHILSKSHPILINKRSSGLPCQNVCTKHSFFLWK